MFKERIKKLQQNVNKLKVLKIKNINVDELEKELESFDNILKEVSQNILKEYNTLRNHINSQLTEINEKYRDSVAHIIQNSIYAHSENDHEEYAMLNNIIWKSMQRYTSDLSDEEIKHIKEIMITVYEKVKSKLEEKPSVLQ